MSKLRIKYIIFCLVQIPGRIWEYCLSMEKYTDDGGVNKVEDKELSKLKQPSR